MTYRSSLLLGSQTYQLEAYESDLSTSQRNLGTGSEGNVWVESKYLVPRPGRTVCCLGSSLLCSKVADLLAQLYNAIQHAVSAHPSPLLSCEAAISLGSGKRRPLSAVDTDTLEFALSTFSHLLTRASYDVRVK